MNIVKELEGTTLTVKLEGRLDTLTAPELEEDMQESLEGVNDLVVDLEAM